MMFKRDLHPSCDLLLITRNTCILMSDRLKMPFSCFKCIAEAFSVKWIQRRWCELRQVTIDTINMHVPQQGSDQPAARPAERRVLRQLQSAKLQLQHDLARVMQAA